MNQPQPVRILDTHELPAPADEAGCGALVTPRGCLPLTQMDIQARICGLASEVRVEQTFVNSANEPVEATYIFPLPDRAAVTSFQLRVADRLIDGVLQERAAARQAYDEAILAGHRAAIAEENRPNAFSLRVGNLMPGDRAVVTLTLTGPLEYADGEATFRFPLVAAPRYIPGVPLPGESAGPGTLPDTDQTPDASLLTPPVLLPGFPNPVRLSLTAEIDPAGLGIGPVACSLHAVETREGATGRRVIRLQPGERLNRDFLLRFAVAEAGIQSSLVVTSDAAGEEGTFQLTLVPPAAGAAGQKPRDVVLLLDRSGSMSGWKIVAARRAAARIVDSLLPADRLAVIAFDDEIDTSAGKSASELQPAVDRARFRAVEFLARLDARGGTEMAAPLAQAVQLLAAADPGRDRILVLVTDGQVGNEDGILKTIGQQARELRIFTLGIDQAVNAGFLRRLAAVGGGACDLVESEDRLDAVMDKIHRRISTPLLTGVCLAAEGLKLDMASLVPERLPDLCAGVPLVVQGRYAGKSQGKLTVTAKAALDETWSRSLAPRASENRAIAALWARGRIRDLEDRYAIDRGPGEKLEQQIVATSLRFGVLSRFTAFVAVDRSEVVNADGKLRSIVQPVELPAGWEEESMGAARFCLAAPAARYEVAESAVDLDEEPREGLVHSLFGSIFGRAGDAAKDESLRTTGSGGTVIDHQQLHPLLQRSAGSSVRKKAKPAYGTASVGGGTPDLTAYRARAAEWIEELARGAGGDHPARRLLLREVASRLDELIADLQSVGAEASVLEPLAKLQSALSALAADSDAALVDSLWETAVQGLAAFAGIRQPFWKKEAASP